MTDHLDNHLAFDMSGSDEREEYLINQIIEFNRSNFELWEQNNNFSKNNASQIYVFAINEQREIVGGLIGRTHQLRAWLEISVIWVKEELRKQGIGRELMKRAEVEARNRDCLYSRLATSQYQAPGFYEKLGYKLYGKLENCPPGETCYYYWKVISSNKL